MAEPNAKKTTQTKAAKAKDAAAPEDTAETKAAKFTKPRPSAGRCPNSEKHLNTRVYKTRGRTRFCKCNDCGETWKVTGKYADPIVEYCAGLAESLDKAPRVEHDDDRLILMEDTLAKQIAADLRDLIATIDAS